MPRHPTPKRYNISDARYQELRNVCFQYPEWKSKLEELDPLHGVSFDGMPKSGGTANGMEKLAIKRAPYESKVKIIEDCAHEAGGDLHEALLLNVTKRAATYNWLSQHGKCYASRKAFFSRRHLFFEMLNEKWP